MKPLLTNSRPTLIETLPKFLTPLSRILTTTKQLNQSTRKIDSEGDLCIEENSQDSRRSSINRVSIRLQDGYVASYKNYE